MKKLLIFASIVCLLGASKLFAEGCPTGYDPHEEYTYGELTLCERTGNKCCTPSPGGGGGEQ